MTRFQPFTHRSLFLALAMLSFNFLSAAQTKKGGTGGDYGQLTVGTDVHHDVSQPLRDIPPSPRKLRTVRENSAGDFICGQ